MSRTLLHFLSTSRYLPEKNTTPTAPASLHPATGSRVWPTPAPWPRQMCIPSRPSAPASRRLFARLPDPLRDQRGPPSRPPPRRPPCPTSGSPPRPDRLLSAGDPTRRGAGEALPPSPTPLALPDRPPPPRHAREDGYPEAPRRPPRSTPDTIVWRAGAGPPPPRASPHRRRTRDRPAGGERPLPRAQSAPSPSPPCRPWRQYGCRPGPGAPWSRRWGWRRFP